MGWDPAEVLRMAERIPWIRDLHLYEEVGSTNDIARDLGEMGAPEGLVVLADAQRAGRGRAGRSWWTPPGVALAISILVRPRRPLGDWPQLTMIAGLAAVEGIETVGCPAGLKWPNDIMIPPSRSRDAPASTWRKAGGILVESVPPTFAVVGIGLNVNTPLEAAPSELVEILGSIRHTMGHAVSRLAVLEGLLQAFARLYDEWNEGASVIERWAARLMMLGQPVRIYASGEVQEGIAESVSAEGGLWLRLPDGRREYFLAGDVSLRWL
ncbi:biotin--[acetyl-CoA-carboxylase] ligase [Thermoflexus sp.]|uniref:biotin--[acetyl-CoA-carboxylase] ligase n=1 Tax=Thermoflexus sp. TaxID=1969742 RepID=UPI0025F69339|nr:biotin--[acetyl-CoA-carboxylase] ligase [Thermoflexus sp.]MDW8179654.1 biotin--[acetyl-CoA-carboxylase] ligase [Anaerolineae bacterium]MCS6963769.1 biotin--[acetyl-CoA-carboxylase] ligase [Thermoflexus sp.]MCS7350203.1 biotin--[acetyl-CoA-carboxylase] ligase [Thermoflexus sp.]MCX7691539.1 biotin--[acetyl-CoA-carboxylase] ligase [Thermoflexus sp.]MDW8184315.1 biotin--[acetyl-CoA-carboxylase] ligase [Anaerolineae bacterium]